MRLGARVSRTIAWYVLALVVVLLIVATATVQQGFREAEDAYARRSVDRILANLRGGAETLGRTVQDWACWDDTYRFVQDRNPGYVKDNLTADALGNLNLDVVVIGDIRGRVVWSWTGGGASARRSAPANVTPLIAPRGPFAGAGGQGIVLVERTPLVVAARPIVRSDRSGPPRGIMLMGRYLGETEMKQIGDSLLVYAGLYVLPTGSPRGMSVADELRAGAAVVVTRGSTTLSAFGLLRDITGTPIALVQANLPRELRALAARTAATYGLAVIAIALAFGIGFLHLLRRHVIGRVESLGDQVRHVNTDEPRTANVTLAGSDELSELATAINGMLGRIGDARDSALEHRRSYEDLFANMRQGCAVHELILDDAGSPHDYRFLAVNPAFERITGLTAEAILGHTVRSVIPELEPVWIERYGRVALTGEHVQFEQDASALGKVFEVSAFPAGPGRFACVFTDITDRRRSEAAERAAEAQTRRRLVQQTAINRLALALGDGLSLNDVARIVHEHVRTMVDAWFFVISSYDERNRVIRAAYAVCGNQVIQIAELPPLPIGEPGTGALSRVLHSAEPLCIPDHRAAVGPSEVRYIVEADGSVRARISADEGDVETTQSAVYLPMKVAGKVVGLMQLQSTRLDAYTADDVELLAGLADVAAVAVQDARLRGELEAEVAAHRDAENRVRSLLAESDRARSALLSILEDQKRAENSLRQSEHRFALAFQTSPYAITITRATDGSFVDVNEAFTTIAGYTRDEALADSSVGLDLWHTPTDRDRVMASLRRGDPVTGAELRFRCKDGRIITAIFSAHLLELRGEVCVLSSINDITERKRSEDILAARLRLTEYAAEHTLQALLVRTLDEAERLTDSSIGFYHLVQPDERTITLQAWSTRTTSEYCTASGEGPHYPVDEAGVWVDCVRERRAVIHNDYASLQHRKGLPDGHAALLRELVTPILRNDRIVAILGVGNKESPYTDSDADAVAYLADVAWEIAERKRGDEERERLQTQLEQAMKLESIGRLAGGVAHDVNNMLMVMMGTCDLMESLTGSGGPIVAHIGRMRRAAERTSALTRQLLAFGRRQTVHLEPLDLNEVVSGTTEMLAQLIGEDIETAIVPCDGPATVKADRSQIEQSLTNLVVNARDAMPSGGRLTIETGFVSLDEEYARTHAYVQPGDYVTLSVTDTGIGIPDEVREHIFEPFFTTKAPGSGTGLGLASVYGAVKQCGGSMEVTSIVGVGTTFRILLPRCYERPTVRAGDRPSAPHGAGHRVLVVDDDAALRDVISALVASLGCKPTTVSDGAAAIRAVQQPGAPPDLVITDVVMPAMNGPELAARLRELVPGLKVLFMSGYTEYADGVIDSDVPLLAKPFTRADLAAAISKLLPLAPPAKGIAVIIVDDDRDVLDLVEMACGRRGHTVVGAQSAQAALRALASRPFDIAVVDNNVAGMDAARIIRMLREAGWRLPIIVYTGDAGSVDTKSLDPLGVVAVIEKSDRLDGLTDAIEAHAHPIPPADDRTG